MNSTAVHGLVQVRGSSTVTSYFSVLASKRLNRSTRCIFSLAPPRPTGESLRKFVESTTNVSPSHRPSGYRSHRSTLLGRCGRLVIEIIRLSYLSSILTAQCAGG